VAGIKALFHTTPMTQNAALRKAHSEAQVGFVLVELDLAAMFCERALFTENRETQERHRSRSGFAIEAGDAWFHGTPGCEVGLPLVPVWILSGTGLPTSTKTTRRRNG